MLFRILASFSFCFLSQIISAQNFTFSPGNDYYGQLEMELYTEHYLYVYHDNADSAYITWRKIENTCPVEWDLQMCDWQHCYSGMPNTGNMNGVAAGNAGNLRLIVNPFNTPGEGTVHFWIFPTGVIEEYVDVYFHFETTATSVTEPSFTNSVSFLSSSNSILLNQRNSGNAQIIDITGHQVQSFQFNHGMTTFETNALASGVYFCVIGDKSFRFFKP
jgi:hypothetical protein